MTTNDIDAESLAYARRQGVLCARVRWTRGQALCAVLLLVVVVVGAVIRSESAWVAGSLVVAVMVAATVSLRLVAMILTGLRDPTLVVPSAELAALDRTALPRYSVLVPLYREPEVVPHLLAALAAIDYPRDRLEVQVLIEPDDWAHVRHWRRAPCQPGCGSP
jgi:hypothetical protein